MNKQTEALKLAREAGAWAQQSKNCDVEYVMSGQSLERFAALVAAAEREACAKVCEAEWSNVAERMYGEECAAAIRARGSNT